MGDIYYQSDPLYLDLQKAAACYSAAVAAGCYTDDKKPPIQVQHRQYLLKPVDEVFMEAEKCRDGYTKTEQYVSGYDSSTYTLPNGSSYTVNQPIYSMRNVHVPPNPTMARFLFEVAAKKGHPMAEEAMNSISTVARATPFRSPQDNAIADSIKYLKGKDGVKKDPQRALDILL
jgi:TPR repeat protein